ncbi:hypothetical protein [Caldimonas tepidiphila]|uniref:hypothetical protein n=1 Tax=Caldimonas tepidiphila TaxID=2315841 RepID=UPI000E5B5219|nr:hypothetical protein [Caldimonas tepidiphila]
MSLLHALRLKPYSTAIGIHVSPQAAGFLDRLSSRQYLQADVEVQAAAPVVRDEIVQGLAASEKGLYLAVEWVKHNALSPYPNLCLGACLMVRAFRNPHLLDEIASADTLPKPAHDSLKKSRDAFARAMLRGPELPDPHAWMVWLELLARAPKEELYRQYAAAVSKDYLHWPAHRNYFFTTTERHGGSRDEMLSFVREATTHTPPGAPIHILTACAHNELFHSAARKSGLKPAGALMKRKDFAASVSNAFRLWLAGPPEKAASLVKQHSENVAFYGLNQFAAAAYLAGAIPEARFAIEALEGRIDRFPWAWMAQDSRESANPAFAFDRICRELDIDPRKYLNRRPRTDPAAKAARSPGSRNWAGR